jgi:CBS domain-containing protein
MKTVRDILRTKGREVWTVRPDATLFEALEKMAEKNVGALVVTKGEDIVGIVSERDYARKVILKGKSSRETRVSEIMTKDTLYVDPDYKVEECMALMTDEHVRHLPVIEKGRIVGIVSIGDVVKAVISEKEFVIEQLEKYIRGHHG